MNIILSIHPKWAKMIYEGKKTIEWRKSIPAEFFSECAKKHDHKVQIVLYETAPVKMITGVAELVGWKRITKETIYEGLHPKIVESGCVPVEYLMAYLGNGKSLWGWELANVKKFSDGGFRNIEDLGLERPPQSWCYTSEMFF